MESDSFKAIEQLPRVVGFSEKEKKNISEIAKIYRMRVPKYYFSLIKEIGNPNDPIRMQCIPSAKELQEEAESNHDPLGEEKTSPMPCLVHRYPDRVLLLVTSRCFMYCRHCTRKRLWKNKISEPSLKEINNALRYIKDNKQIREVIVSGGDPFTLPTEKLDYILSAIYRSKNIEAIRIGTRTPVVFPFRINSELCAALTKYNNLWVNVQFNHPREITFESVSACRRLQGCSIPISNQAVLLKGINDDPEIMTKLCQRLQGIRIRPYYLFQCDPVIGTSHFRTPLAKGVEIMKKMRGHTGGMCVPEFVIDGPGGKGKIPLGPNYLISTSHEGVLLRNYREELLFYRDPARKTPAPKNKEIKPALKKIGIIFNLKKGGLADDREEEYDEIVTIESLKKEIEKLGFEVLLFEQTGELTSELRRQSPGFVVNLAEGVASGRSRESEVPCILESLGIPYSGSDPVALGITLDKHLTGRILKAAEVSVPRSFMAENINELESLKNIFKNGRSFIVKPRWEGSSKGIFTDSCADNLKALKEKVLYLLCNYGQPALIEEFLEGEEITVGIHGNKQAKVLGMMKITPQNKNNKRFLYSLEAKKNWRRVVKYEPRDSISTGLQGVIGSEALKAYRVLELRDMARIDFRVSRSGAPKVIDVNPLPGFSPVYSDLPIMYKLQGGSYGGLVRLFLREALERCGFSHGW